MNRKLISAAVLLAGLAVSASAQVSFNGGDLYLGVRVNPNGTSTGNNDLIVDLGSANNFFQSVDGGFANGGTDTALAAGTSYTWSLAADLNTAIGTNVWKTAGNSVFSIVGADNQGHTNAEYDTNWVAAPSNGTLHVGAQGDQDNFAGTIQLFTANLNGSPHNTAIANGLFISKSNALSYTTAVQVGQPNTFGNNGGFYGMANVETDTASGQGAALWMLEPDTGPGSLAVDLGTFTLNSSGVLTFTAIPEPSTYAMILGVFALGFVMLRRRAQVLA